MIYKFLFENPVFTRSEFEQYRKQAGGSTNPGTIQQLLEHYCEKKMIVRLRRDLFYANIGQGDTVAPLSYLIAGKLSPDSVIAYHTAMMMRGNAYSMFYYLYYLSSHQIRQFEYNNQIFKSIKPQKEVIKKGNYFFETETLYVDNQPIKVTTIERTLIDSLDKPLLAGGWEELWRNFDNIPIFKWDNLLAYIGLFDNALLHAKLGFYLSIRKKQGIQVPAAVLKQLATNIPKKSRDIDLRSRFSSHQAWKLIKPWRLLVPEELLTQNWEEVYHDIDY